MSIATPLLQALQSSALGQALSGAPPALIVTFQLLHIVGLLLLLTAVLLLALRLTQLGLRSLPLETVAALARPLLWGGLAAAVFSGLAMFASNPLAYGANPALQIKLGLLVLAVLLQLSLVRQLVARPAQGLLAQAGAIASLLLWFSTGLAGRAIGFV